MFTYFLSFSCLILFAEAFPRNLVADAFATQEGSNFHEHLSKQDEADSVQLSKLYQDLIGAGIGVGLQDYVNMAKHKYPHLYEKLVDYQKVLQDREDSLPEKVRKFILDRRAEVKQWFTNGVLNVHNFVTSARAIAQDAEKMDDTEKEALFGFYPLMKDLLNDEHYKKILHGSGDMVDELKYILDS